MDPQLESSCVDSILCGLLFRSPWIAGLRVVVESFSL